MMTGLTATPAVYKEPTILPITDTKIDAILGICHYRDNPRLLARIAYGISSPRTGARQLNLNKNPLFGCLMGHDWQTLLSRFEAECQKSGFQNLPASLTKTSSNLSNTTNNKRSYHFEANSRSYPSKKPYTKSYGQNKSSGYSYNRMH